MPTLTIDNLGGPLTRKNNGDINSGQARFETSWGYDPFSKPGNLTWMEQPTSILTSATGADTDVIVAMKQRSTGSVLSVYALDANGRLFSIRVDNVASNTADLDTPSVISGGQAGGFTVTRNNGMAFFGDPEKIFYGNGQTAIFKVNFDGSSNASIFGTGSVISGVPRPMTTFLGRLYYGNSNNIGEIDSTELVTTGSKLSPALPIGVVVRDLDVTPDGNYLQITTSNNNISNNFTNLDTTLGGAANSHKFLWNGIDSGATAIETYEGTLLTASNVLGNKNYAFGYDQRGGGIYLGQEKRVSLPKSTTPQATAVFSSGNMTQFMTVEREEPSGELRAAMYGYGKDDDETPGGLFRFLRVNASVGGSEIRAVPNFVPVSNLLYFPTFDTYSGDIATSGKVYFTTIENDQDAETTGRVGRTWRHRIVPTGVGSIVAGVYETQTQLFSKKVKIGEVRVYTEPLVGGNDFIVDLIGSGGSVISGGSQRFQVATGSVVAGTDMVQFNPVMAPTYALGVRITNSSTTGVANWTGRKLEVDWEPAGK